MVQYYILLKKKGSQKYFGAVRAKKGVSLPELRDSIKSKYPGGIIARIVNTTKLKKIKSSQRTNS